MIVALSLLAATAAPTLEEITRLPPAAAGELALAGHPHAPIVEIRRGWPGSLPPGLTELLMTERPTALPGGGCMRRQWSVGFRRDAVPYRLEGAFASTEITVRSGRDCPTTGYVEIGDGVSADRAVGEMTRVQGWWAGNNPPHYRCTDHTDSRLCATSAELRLQLARTTPWMIKREREEIVLWMGQRGGVVTELRYVPGDRVTTATVTRFIPAPF